MRATASSATWSPRKSSEESRSRVEAGEAALADANVAIDTAKLNLQRATIVSPVDGYLNDRAPRAGEFVAAGRAVVAVVDMHSFRVDGYFEETKLGGIDIGQPVDITVMGEPTVLRGHVQSIVAGDRGPRPHARLESAAECESGVQLGAARAADSGARRARRSACRLPHDRRPHRDGVGA